MENSAEMRISNITRDLMLGTALFIDLVLDSMIGLIPVIGDLIVPFFAWLLFWMWFKIHGVSMFEKIFGRMIAVIVIDVMIGMVPVIGDATDFFIPAWTLITFWQIQWVRRKDLLVANEIFTRNEIDSIEKAIIDRNYKQIIEVSEKWGKRKLEVKRQQMNLDHYIKRIDQHMSPLRNPNHHLPPSSGDRTSPAPYNRQQGRHKRSAYM